MKTFYDLLNVSENATLEEIEESYKNLKNKYESYLLLPQNKEKAEEYLKKLDIAFKVLSNSETKSSYDKDLVKMRNDELMSNLQKNTSDYNKEVEEKAAQEKAIEEKKKQEEIKAKEEEDRKKKLEYVQSAIEKQIAEQQKQLDIENEQRQKIQQKIEKEYKKYVRKNKRFSLTRTLYAIIVVFVAVFLITRIPFVQNYITERFEFLKSILG